MKMKETDFIDLLVKKAKENERLVKSGVLPEWAAFLGEWLGVNPWRVIGLAAIVVYVGLRLVLGEGFREGVLKIFGGF